MGLNPNSVRYSTINRLQFGSVLHLYSLSRSHSNRRKQSVWDRKQDNLRSQRRMRRSIHGYGSSLGLSDEDSDDNYYVPGDRRSGRYFDVSSYNTEAPAVPDNPALKVSSFSRVSLLYFSFVFSSFDVVFL